MPITIETRPTGTRTSAVSRSGFTQPVLDRRQHKGQAGKSRAAAHHQQRPHPAQLAQPLAGDVGARRVMAADPPHQPHGKRDRAEPDQHARRSQHQPGGCIDVRILLQRQQRKIETGMQRQRHQQDQDSAGDARPVAVMPVRAERRAGARDRKIGAGDDAQRAVERHRQHAAQYCQRPPHVRVLHEIGEVLVGREAETGRGAIDHGVHRVGEAPAPRRDRDDDEDLDDLLGRRDPEDRMQRLRNPGVLGGCEDRHERRARNAQQRNAGGAEQKRGPDLGRRPGALVGGDHQPQHQQGRRDGGGADDGRKGCKEIHKDGKYAIFPRYLRFEMLKCAASGAANVPEPRPRAIARSATPADILQPRIHHCVFRADRIDIFRVIGFRGWRFARGFCRFIRRRRGGNGFRDATGGAALS